MNKKLLALVLAVALMASLAVLPAAAAGKFPDAVGTWAESSIDRWADVGLIQGDTNGNVNPTQNLTRAEMAAVLVRLMGLTAKADADTFSDVAADDWFADVVLQCAAAKIMLGDGAGHANPNDSITREQAATMICRALGLKAKTSHSLEQFDDANAVSSYAKDYMATLTSLGALKGVGDGTTLAPQTHIDRASALALLDRLIKAYVTTAGEVEVDDANGFVVVNTADAGSVTVTGEAAGVLVATGNKADVKLSKFNADTVKVDSPVAVTIDGSTKLGTVEVNAAAKVDSKGVVGEIKLNDKDATSNVTTDNSKPSGGGSSSGGSVTINKPRAVTFAYTTAGEAVAEGGEAIYTAANITGLDEDGKARKGTEITFTVTGASEEYPVVEVTGDTADPKANAEGVYSFTMPNRDVVITINAAAEAEEPAVKDAKIVFITAENYETLAPTYNYYGATAETLRPAADVQLPWLLVSYNRVDAEGDVSFSVKKDGQAVKFGADNEDALVFAATSANENAWVSFHLASQAETDHKDQVWLNQAAEAVDGEYEVTVTMNGDTATATATYPPVPETPDEPAVKDAEIVFITAENYAELAETYDNYGAEGELPDASKVQLPWLLVNYNRATAGEVSFTITKDGQAVKFGANNDDALVFTAAAANENAWVSFHLASQAETDHKDQVWLNQAADAIEGEYEVTVTLGEDSAKATATYSTTEEPATILGDALTMTQLSEANAHGYYNYLVRTTRTAKFTQANIKITSQADEVYVNYTFTMDPADMNETGGVGMEWSLHKLANGGTATGDDEGATEAESNDANIVPAGTVKVTITVTGADNKEYVGNYTYEITQAMCDSVKMPTTQD